MTPEERQQTAQQVSEKRQQWQQMTPEQRAETRTKMHRGVNSGRAWAPKSVTPRASAWNSIVRRSSFLSALLA